jgi:hypothetical protein
MNKNRINSPLRFGHGLNRAKKIIRKHNSKEVKHKRKWLELKMDNQ